LLPAAARAQVAQATTREQLLLLAARLGVGVTIVAGHHGYTTNKWNIGGTLRGKITDDDIDLLEGISGSQGNRANLPHGICLRPTVDLRRHPCSDKRSATPRPVPGRPSP